MVNDSANFGVFIQFYSITFKISKTIQEFIKTTHVGRQRKGSVALRVGLLPASFALAGVPPSFCLLSHYGVLVSGNPVGKQCCTPRGMGSVVEVGTACRHGNTRESSPEYINLVKLPSLATRGYFLGKITITV